MRSTKHKPNKFKAQNIKFKPIFQTPQTTKTLNTKIKSRFSPPVFISLDGFISHFIFRRELQGMFFALGLLISQFVKELIKTSVQQALPETCALLEMCDSHGWPSSHSQYMFFSSVYFSLMTAKRYGLFRTKSKWAVHFWLWSMAFLTMYSRVYLGYHTVAQVFAGAILGAFLGVVWLWFEFGF